MGKLRAGIPQVRKKPKFKKPAEPKLRLTIRPNQYERNILIDTAREEGISVTELVNRAVHQHKLNKDKDYLQIVTNINKTQARLYSLFNQFAKGQITPQQREIFARAMNGLESDMDGLQK